MQIPSRRCEGAFPRSNLPNCGGDCFAATKQRLAKTCYFYFAYTFRSNSTMNTSQPHPSAGECLPPSLGGGKRIHQLVMNDSAVRLAQQVAAHKLFSIAIQPACHIFFLLHFHCLLCEIQRMKSIHHHSQFGGFLFADAGFRHARLRAVR